MAVPARCTYYVYLLECADGSLYTGITTDVERRFREHQQGIGGRYTRAKGAVRVVYTEEQTSRSAALKREAQLKRLSRKKKLELRNRFVSRRQHDVQRLSTCAHDCES